MALDTHDAGVAARSRADVSRLDGEPVVRFEGVGKRFATGTVALTNIHLHVGDGELVAVVGPSGCGKSTLLRLASGLTNATSGDVAVTTNEIGYIFQDATLMPWRSVLRNVELGTELRHMRKAARRQRAQAAIDLVGLQGFEQQLPGHLSGGMRMRVSLARALALDPEVFLFDEPFGALDEITRLKMQEELQRLFTQRRFAGLFITHSVPEACYLANRVVVMSSQPGRIVAEVGIPFDHPRDPSLRFDADFTSIVSTVSTELERGSH